MQYKMELAEQILEMNRRSWVADSRTPMGLTQSEYLALDYLSKHGTSTVGDIREGVGVLAAQMSRVLRSLEESALVTCSINAGDKRKVDVTMTPEGEKAYSEFRRAKLGRILNALDRLTKDEQSQFMNLLHKLVASPQSG